MLIEWQKTAKMLEKGFDFENRFSSLTYKEKEGGVDNLSETSEELLRSEKPLDWVAFKNQFFSCVLIGHQDLAQASLSSKPAPTPDVPVRYESPLKEYSATMQTAFDGKASPRCCNCTSAPTTSICSRRPTARACSRPTCGWRK